MAYFAKIVQKTDPTGITNDTHWIVESVIKAGNDIETSNGPLGENDMHVDGETYCQTLFKGGIWKQTSYNSNFRKQYAGLGYVYNEEKDVFIAPQTFQSWILNNDNDWEAPISFPSIIDDGQENPEWFYNINWDEDLYQSNNNKGWIAFKSNDEEDPLTTYDWNGSAWVSR